MLTDAQSRNAQPKDKPYKLTDGKGLYLEIKPKGAKAWCYRFKLTKVGEVKAPCGAKRDQVLTGIDRLAARPGGNFTIGEVEQVSPWVSRDMVGRVLREQQAAGVIECHGRGPAAKWRKT